jgi:Protein of unknown function (DUF4238)
MNSPMVSEDGLIEDPEFIEKRGFMYENTLMNLLSNFINSNPITNILLQDRLLDVLLSLKHRTKFYRKEIAKESADKSKNAVILEKEGKKLQALLEEITTYDRDTISKHIEEAKAKLLNGPARPEESHHRGLIDNAFGVNEAVHDAKKIMLTMKVCVLHPASSKSYFVTSDNPGFTWLDHKIFNTNYGRFDAVGFPLTSRDLVYFVESGSYQTSNFVRPLFHMYIDDFQVHLANTCSILNCDEAVFCEDRVYLESTVGWFKKQVDDHSISLVS